jgi:hypothetical protein
MTLDQVFDAFVAAMRDRLDNLPDPPDELSERVDALTIADMAAQAQDLLNTIPVAADAGTGSCTYQVGGQAFCLENITAIECANLGGTFTKDGVCSLPPWPPM